MRNFFVAVLFLSIFFSVKAQELNILKSLDKPDSTYNSKVIVNNNANINLNERGDFNVRAYRVRLYFDNKQDSRSMAYSIKSHFESLYPTIPVKVEYKIPNFMVTAGYFLTHVEATSFLAKVQQYFNGAFIIPVDVPMSTFKTDLISPATVDIPVDTMLVF